MLVSLAEEGVNDDGNEEIEEDLGDNDLEEQVEGHSEGISTALRTVSVSRVVTTFNDRVVVFVLDALVQDGPWLARVKHD